jgi:hypothetical protein
MIRLTLSIESRPFMRSLLAARSLCFRRTSIILSVSRMDLLPHTTAGSSGVRDHLGARFSQPSGVTTTASSCLILGSPWM